MRSTSHSHQAWWPSGCHGQIVRVRSIFFFLRQSWQWLNRETEQSCDIMPVVASIQSLSVSVIDQGRWVLSNPFPFLLKHKLLAIHLDRRYPTQCCRAYTGTSGSQEEATMSVMETKSSPVNQYGSGYIAPAIFRKDTKRIIGATYVAGVLRFYVPREHFFFVDSQLPKSHAMLGKLRRLKWSRSLFVLGRYVSAILRTELQH